MEESKKKSILIGVIVVCLGVAALITLSRRSGGGGGLEDIPDEELTWVMCNNPDCKAEYQMALKEYFKAIEERFDPMVMATPPLVCKECGEPSVYDAEKCENPDCGMVFLTGSAGAGDFTDRCPECGNSAMEESRKRRREAREAGGAQ